MSEWSKFFAVRMPIVLVAFALLVQTAAGLLSGVTLHRHLVDDLAVQVLRDRHAYRVVLLGDSVTHIVAHQFRIGGLGEVADLTTHAAAGLPSSLFLLKRYLESGHRPEIVILAASANVYVYPIDKADLTYNVSSVFKAPFERDFLQRYYPELDYRWRPAALSMATTIGEPLLSLLRRPADTLPSAREAAPDEPVLEHFADDSYDSAVFASKVDSPASILPEAAAAIRQMLALSRQYGFSLHIIWAPVQSDLRAQLLAKGNVARINRQLRGIIEASGVSASIDDSNDAQNYPYFDRELSHIRGVGWEEVYANQLSGYVHRFESQLKSTDALSSNAVSTAAD